MHHAERGFQPEIVTVANQAVGLLEDYFKKRIERRELIAALKQWEGSHWYFTLDKYTLLIRNRDNPEESYVVRINQQKLKAEAKPLKLLESIDKSQELKDKYQGKKIIAFCGSARGLEAADQYLIAQIVTEILRDYKPEDVMILTGGYSEGVPYFAAMTAHFLGFETIAITPSIANEATYGGIDGRVFDYVEPVGEYWGEERNTLVGFGDEFYFIGGGKWTTYEYNAARKRNKKIRFVDALGKSKLSTKRARKYKTPEDKMLEIPGYNPIRVTQEPGQDIIES